MILGHRLMNAGKMIGHKMGQAVKSIGHKIEPTVNLARNVINTVDSVQRLRKNLLTRG